jgi:hypothetical protein
VAIALTREVAGHYAHLLPSCTAIITSVYTQKFTDASYTHLVQCFRTVVAILAGAHNCFGDINLNCEPSMKHVDDRYSSPSHSRHPKTSLTMPVMANDSAARRNLDIYFLA